MTENRTVAILAGYLRTQDTTFEDLQRTVGSLIAGGGLGIDTQIRLIQIHTVLGFLKDEVAENG